MQLLRYSGYCSTAGLPVP